MLAVNVHPSRREVLFVCLWWNTRTSGQKNLRHECTINEVYLRLGLGGSFFQRPFYFAEKEEKFSSSQVHVLVENMDKGVLNKVVYEFHSWKPARCMVCERKIIHLMHASEVFLCSRVFLCSEKM